MSARAVPGSTANSGARRSAGPFLLLLAIYVLLLAGYVSLRYGGRVVQDDATALTLASQSVLAGATIAPPGGYPHGYAYPTLNTFLAHLTGASIESLQSSIQPLLVVLLVPISFAAYRSLTGRRRVAMLASLLLFLSPEFLFEATRSSHAKMTWLLALTMLFILARSLRPGRHPGWLVPWVAAFYLTTFALITSNTFFASGYIFGIAFAFTTTLILLSLKRVPPALGAPMRRLSYVTASTWLLVFLFVFYLYPPARSVFGELRSTLDRLSVFLLNVEPTAGVDPYAYTQSTWLSLGVYLALTAFNWAVLLLSFAVWLRQGWLLWMRRIDMPAHRLLLWLLYGSFGFLMVLSVLVDLSGGLSTNLQLRIFAHFLLVGIPLASEGIFALIAWARRNRPSPLARAAPVALVALLSLFALGALLKITNEPLLSNQWSFYTEEERRSAQWVGSHVRNNQVWTGRDFRLPTVARAYGNWSQQNIRINRGGIPVNARYVLWSDVSQERADRIGEPLPDTRQSLIVYDAGGAELYYSRPKTPYQR
ncbi:MAG: hypothetical protein WA040_17680 [Anaerolineae bacterium]